MKFCMSWADTSLQKYFWAEPALFTSDLNHGWKNILRRFQNLLGILNGALDAVGSRLVEEFLVIVQTRLQAHAAQQANDSYKYMFHKSILF